MTDRCHAPSPEVHLPRDDHAWLARFAEREHTSIHASAGRAVRHFRVWHEGGAAVVREALEFIDRLHREYRRQLAHEQNLRRSYEKALHRERSMRRAYQKALRDERGIRRTYEDELWQQGSRYGRQVRAGIVTARNPVYSPTVAKLLTLAVCSGSGHEAHAALVKARALHRSPACRRPAERGNAP